MMRDWIGACLCAWASAVVAQEVEAPKPEVVHEVPAKKTAAKKTASKEPASSAAHAAANQASATKSATKASATHTTQAASTESASATAAETRASMKAPATRSTAARSNESTKATAAPAPTVAVSKNAAKASTTHAAVKSAAAGKTPSKSGAAPTTPSKSASSASAQPKATSAKPGLASPPMAAVPVAPAPVAPAPPPQPSAANAGRVSVPSTPHFHVDVPAGLQAWLDADDRMRPWLGKAVSATDSCYAQLRRDNPSAAGVITFSVTMHPNARPTGTVGSLPAPLRSLVPCVTSSLWSVRMPLFTGDEGARYEVSAHFEP